MRASHRRPLSRLLVVTIAAAATVGTPSALASSGDLWTYGTAATGDTGHVLYPASSPAIADMSGGGYEMAYQTTGAALAVAGSVADTTYGLGMMPGSSPAIARQPGNGWEAAFEANTTSLWTCGTSGPKNWALGMHNGTSPAIGELANGGYQAAFEANSDVLWTAGSAGTANTQDPMWPGTAPAVAAVGTSGTAYQLVIQGPNSSLQVDNPPSLQDAGLGLQTGTSPADTTLTTRGTEVAFQANSHILWTYGSGGNANTGKAMAPGTNPSIARLANGGFEVAYQAADGNLAVYGSAATLDTGVAMAPGTSPAIAGLAGGGYEVAFQAKPPPPPTPAQPTPPPASTTPVPVPPPVPATPGHRTPRTLRVKIVIGWHFGPVRTRLTRITLDRLPRNARLELVCRGRGCPRKPLTGTRRHLRRFERRLAGARFRVGDRVYLRITARGYRAERVLARVRRSDVPLVSLV